MEIFFSFSPYLIPGGLSSSWLQPLSLPNQFDEFLLPIKSVKGKVSRSGHGLGLVYYAISWTVLALLFFDRPWIIAVGIAAMSYSNGMASLIGGKFGKTKYNIFRDNKTMKGQQRSF